MKKIIILIVVVVVLAGGYAIIRASSLDSNSSEPLAQETTHVQQQRTQPPASIVRKEPVKPLAPDFTLKDLNNGTITLSSYQGDKPVVLDFFATWCPNCQRDMPILSSLYDKYKDEVEVIGVNMQESKSTVDQFRRSYNISFPIVLDPGRIALKSYGIFYTNVHVLINKKGEVVRTIPGDIRESDIESLLES
ncbi:MAG: redoxin domain-containing protein [Candidatus Jacksonbacteria bacterium]|nr:redoxin domain-containing protein [Candidatus Jacksonbacteria bacterium]MBT6300838.1 redoxin domain-containing protein [Candidatus Jacksonbacteria bacterium]MBT6757208.1 redoxin domain-containing protein [Candidatus Jacksonbacteria bacterium]MBT6954855.1 redoxin domain-containing protein [Candidatus Jacksonbacteria bacterium]MBT7008184.1 redoxin domain-containing protein [Candidatus Jacksonbacteria bacterium]